MKQQLVIGIGTGRCGTKSLVNLLNRQLDSRVTHERRPLLPWNRNVPRVSIKDRFQLMLKCDHKIVGDVAFFYLPYLKEILGFYPDARVICLKRDREEVVQSFCRWIDSWHSIPTNNWAKQPASGWFHDPVWAPCFPKYEGIDSREDAIRRYWDEYYQEVTRLMKSFPDNIRVFEVHHAMNSEEGVRELLNFIRIPEYRHRISFGDRANQTDKEHSDRSQPLVGMDSPKQCVLLVPYRHQIFPHCEASLKALERKGYPVWRIRIQATLDQARSQITTGALLKGFTETLWIDPDIGFAPADVERLRRHNLPITCGVCPRVNRQGLAFHMMPGVSKLVLGQGGSLQEVISASAGFLHVRRHVYETIQQDLSLPLCNEGFGQVLIPFFQPLIRHGAQGTWYLADDESFCHRIRQCRFKIMADMSIRLVRFGEYAYSWEDVGIEKQRFTTVNYKLSDGNKKHPMDGDDRTAATP